MKAVAYTPEALADLENIFAYIARDNPHAARAGRVQGTYEMPVSRLPYIIAFELPDKATLRVLRIIHMSRDWPAGGWPEA